MLDIRFIFLFVRIRCVLNLLILVIAAAITYIFESYQTLYSTPKMFETLVTITRHNLQANSIQNRVGTNCVRLNYQKQKP